MGSGTTVIRWMARGTALLLVTLVVTVAVAEGVPSLATQPTRVQVEFIALALMVVGSLVGMKRERIGGATELAGFVLFAGTELLASHKFPGGVIPLFAIPGILYLVSDRLSRQG